MRQLLAVIAVCARSACTTVSIHPWFGDEARLFDERLIGTWGDDTESFTISRGQDDTYRLRFHDGSPEMRAVLGEVNGNRYLELRLDRSVEGYEPWAYVTHRLCKVAIEETRFRPVCLDTDKMEAFVEAGELQGVSVGHDLLVVSKTAQLERFLAQHGRGADIWLEADDDDWHSRRSPENIE